MFTKSVIYKALKVFSITLLCSFPVTLIAQVNLSGELSDSKTMEPVPFAAVYVNGTSKGAISNAEGRFELKGITFPCEVVISHVGYEKDIINIDENSSLKLNLTLIPIETEISEIKVVNSDLRAKNVEIFERCFLGSDKWGEKAELLNDSVLIFDTNYFGVVTSDGASKKSWGENLKDIESMKVRAYAPLQVYLPQLGYNVHIDLESFEIIFDTALKGYATKFLAQYFYSSVSDDEGGVKSKYLRNREKVYYNSSMHFIRSLFNNELSINGYNIRALLVNEAGYYIKDSVVNLSQNLQYYSDNMAVITGLNGQYLAIEYFSKSVTAPLNLSEKKDLTESVDSEIMFLEDSCFIRKDGTITDTSILFNNEIGNKKVGASLPSDYTPVNQSEE